MAAAVTFGRLGTIKLNELQALTVIGAIRREIERLETLADACRDRGDADAWALFRMQRWSLLPVKSEVLGMLGGHDSPSGPCMEALGSEVERLKAKMPGSVVKTNVETADAPLSRHAGRRKYGRQKHKRINHAAVVTMHEAGQSSHAIRRRFRISKAQLDQIIELGALTAAPATVEASPEKRREPVDQDALMAMVEAGARPIDIQKHFGISRTYFYKVVGQRRGERASER